MKSMVVGLAMVLAAAAPSRAAAQDAACVPPALRIVMEASARIDLAVVHVEVPACSVGIPAWTVERCGLGSCKPIRVQTHVNDPWRAWFRLPTAGLYRVRVEYFTPHGAVLEDEAFVRRGARPVRPGR